MKRISILLILMVLFTNCKSQSEYFDLAFQDGNNSCVIQNDLKKKQCFSNAINPCLSTDGKQLAITKPSGNNNNYSRYISIINLKTKKETKLNVNNNNYYGPMWSPDNNYIAFNILINNSWTIGLIKSDNTDFKTVEIESDLFSPTWLSGNEFFLAQNNGSMIYKFDLKCKLVDSIDIQKIIGENYFITSSSKFLYTSDNQFIVFNCDINESLKNVDGPLQAIFSFNIASKTIVRLSPKGMFAADPFVETDNNILFAGSLENENYKKVYRTDLSGKHLQMIIENGINPTSRKK